MEISLPGHIGYEELRLLLENKYEASFLGKEKCAFNWRKTQWVNLPELVCILNWSSKLVHAKRDVIWLLPNPVVLLEGLSDAREKLRPFVRIETFARAIQEVEAMKRLAAKRKLLAGQRRAGILQICASLTQTNPNLLKGVQEWLHSELGALEAQDLLAFFKRYQVFEQAIQSGITMVPDYRTLAFASYEHGAHGPCLELKSLLTSTDVERTVAQLCDQNELQTILGTYSNMDIVSRGALAHILANELGHNVEEHANASAAYICTRLVAQSDYGFQLQGDPARTELLKLKGGFLEVLVSDNGIGLAEKMEPVLRKDTRKSVMLKYSSNNKPYSSGALVDYAFDRLSSSKRNIADLVHWSALQEKASFPLASGLYWIWNLVRTQNGLLEVRSSGISGRYSFIASEPNRGGNDLFKLDPAPFPCCGTMIRICLPLRQTAASAKPILLGKTVPRYRGKEEFVWAGHLARDLYASSAVPDHEQTPLLLSESPEMLLLRKLQEEHTKLHDRGVLVLNLCGARDLWTKRAAAPLCHFFLHLNYTGTAGSSAVVLWNVPIASAALFDQGIEDARQPYRHLKGLHRVALMIYDTGVARLVCSSAEFERILNRLAYSERLPLDSLVGKSLTNEERLELDSLISSNTHIFHRYTDGDVGLLAWRDDLRGRVWKNDLAWLELLLDTSVKDHGVRENAGTGYFRLPSSGLLVKSFYSFMSCLCNKENCARVAWMLFQLILQIESEKKAKVRWIVAVTRSASPLAQHLFDNYLKSRGESAPECLFAGTIEDLERQANEKATAGTAIFITDVISTGTLSARVGRALCDKLQWLGTIAILDTRTSTRYWTVEENAGPAQGIEYLRADGLGTGPAFMLKHRPIAKLDPLKCKGAPIIAIDSVNVIPITPPNIDSKIQRIWKLLDRAPNAMKVGHYCSKGLNHYVYYISIRRLLDATQDDGTRTLSLRDILLMDMEKELRKSGYHPNHTVIIHPPNDESDAHLLGILAQERTDVLYRQVMHRDAFASQQRFSTFINHGDPSDSVRQKRVAVVIDDGTNTGETLMGLIDAAAYDEPAHVLVYCALARLPLYKLDFFRRLQDLGRGIKLSVKFAVRLTIPVYSRPSCPICRFAAGLDAVIHRSPLLCRYARQLRVQVEPIQLQESQESEASFLWKCSSQIEAARFREALELADYFNAEHEYVGTKIASASRCTVRGKSDLLNIAFVAACEPDVLGAPLFAPHFAKLQRSVCNSLLDCSDTDLLTLFTLAFYLEVQCLKRGNSPKECKRGVEAITTALLSRQDESINSHGQLLAACLAEFWPESDPDSSSCRAVCLEFGRSLQIALAASIRGKKDYVRAFACFLTREFLSDLTRETCNVVFEGDDASLDFFDFTNAIAAKFWWHAAKHCKKDIDSIRQHSDNWNAASYGAVGDAINDLCLAFNSLQEMRRRINRSESALRHNKGVLSGANIHWKSEHMSLMLDGFATAIALTAEGLEQSVTRPGLETRLAKELESAWRSLEEHLRVAFDDVFPESRAIAEAYFNQFAEISGLPSTALLPAKFEVNRANSRVFVPTVVLENYFEEALRNLRTSAFASWSAAQKATDAKVSLSITQTQDSNGKPFLEIVISDNGPLHSHGESPTGDHGRALNEIATAVKDYDGTLERPVRGDLLTQIRLRLRHRLLELPK